jgi:transposase
MMNLICVGDGDVPVLIEIASGSQSDKTRFAQLFQEFSKQWTFDGLCVGDEASYSADNITAMTGLKWLTRLPLSISTAAQLVDEVVDLAPTGIQGYTLKESSSEYAGVEQRWFLIESELSTNPSRVSNVAFAFSKTHFFLLQAFFSNHPNALLRLA